MDKLTTGESQYVDDIIEPFCDDGILMMLVAVWPRKQRTGFLEEQGEWILSFWAEMLASVESIVGCRTLWNTVFFAIDGSHTARTEKVLQEALQMHTSKALKSVCVTLEMAGSLQDKLMAFDEMQAEVSSEDDFNTHKMIKNRFVDGNKLKVHE